MRRNVTILAVAALLAVAAALAAGQAAPAVNQSVELKVQGMTCADCAKKVEAALKGVAGVKAVEVSLEKGTAQVQTSGTVKMASLSSAVQKAGYKVAGDHDAKDPDCAKKCPLDKKHQHG
ncbi:MAG TPA: heavy metal-associated domain-containing protein [Thermoanaerobaculia bacterium]|nr:heavy metal-associated domain-containing protein [Thermoanaerobaculia bacterium]